MKVKIEIELEYKDEDVSPHMSETERMLETNFAVAEGLYDLGVGVSPTKIDVHIEALEDE